MTKSGCKYELRFVVILLKCCGLLPLESAPKLASLAIAFVTVTSYVSILLPAAYGLYLFWEDNDVDDLIHFASLHERLVFFVVRFSILFSKSSRIKESLRTCETLWKSAQNEPEFEDVKLFFKRTRYLVYGLFVNGFFLLTNIQFSPLFVQPIYDENGTVIKNGSLPFPIGYVPTDRSEYYLWFTAQVTAGYPIGFSIMGCNIIIVVLVLHGIAHMKVVKYRLKNIVDCLPKVTKDSSTLNLSDHREAWSKYVECVRYHQNVLRYCQQLEDLFNYVVLLHVVVDSIVAAIVSVYLLREDSPKVELELHMAILFSEMLLACLLPEILTSECHAITEVVYSLPWTGWSSKDRQLLRILITRSQQPVVMTAGKCFSMSLSTFSEIISKTASVFAVLRATM